MKSSDRYSKENLMGLEPELLRAIIRERTHHTVEGVIYRALRGRISLRPDHGELVKRLLEIWKERGLPQDLPDLQWSSQLLSIIENLKHGVTPEMDTVSPRPLPDEEICVVKRAIYGRRSVRSFTDEEVPRQIIESVIESGLQAPHACNLQTIRIIVVDDEESLALFGKGEVAGAPVYLVICQDYRPYEFFKNQIPDYNRSYDVGAAVQNMLLMANALGLGSVWLTYGEDQAEKIRTHYDLPKHLHISTYVALGWPLGGVIPPKKIRVEEAILARER
jgi:nitroreductase